MGEPTTKLGLRLTRDAWDNFQHVLHRDDLTVRSTVEAGMELVAMFCAPGSDERRALVSHLDAETLERVVAAAWRAVYEIDARHGHGREPRESVTVRTDPERLAYLRDCVKSRKLSVNAAIVSVWTPWGSEWVPHGDPAYQLRLDLWEWAAGRARERDRARRRHHTRQAPSEVAPDVTSRLLAHALRMS